MAHGTAALFTINAVAYPVKSESFKKQGAILRREGVRGSRARDIDDIRVGPYSVSGSFTIEPTPAELSAVLQLAMGGSALAEAPTEFDIVADRSVDTWTYEDCKVSKLTLSSSAGQLTQCTLDVIGKTAAMTGDLSSAPTSATPFQHADWALTLNSVTCTPEDWTFSIDNHLIAKYRNSLTATDLQAEDRTITLSANVPSDTTHDDLMWAGSGGIAGTLVGTIGGLSITLTFTKLVAPDEDPTMGGRSEILIPLNYTAYADGATAEFTLTSDLTP